MPCLNPRRPALTELNRINRALELLSCPQRELVVEILEYRAPPVRSSDSRSDAAAFLRFARMRLRNIVEKHSEALKRARLAVRTGAPRRHIEVLEEQLWICTEALAICDRHLERIGNQG